MRQQQTAATAVPTDDPHQPPSALRPAQMTSIDLPAAIWHGEGHLRFKHQAADGLVGTLLNSSFQSRQTLYHQRRRRSHWTAAD